jgi:NapH/MauN family ferredoxin-type protein
MNYFKKISLRTIIQFSIVILVVVLSLIHQKLGVEKAAPVDAYCPFGAIESLFTLIFKGEFLKRIFTSSFILMGIFFLATLFLGRVFCGYFCPLGAIQEWLRKLGRLMGIKKDLEIPEKFDKYFRYIKYAVLALVVYYSFYLGDLIFRNYDPYSSLMHFGAELEEKIFGYSILAIIVIISLFSKSLWCRYFCPLGAFFGIIKKLSFFSIKRDNKTCISCGICDNVCPANLKIQNVDVINHADCISCGNCVTHCPKSSLSYRILKKPISKKIFLAILIMLVIIPLAIAPYTSFWKTKPESNIVNFKGEINVADIRGSNTLQYVIDVTKIPLEEFKSEFNMPKNVDTSLKLKEIGSVYNLINENSENIDTEDFRKFIEYYIANGSKIKQEEANHLQSKCPFEEENCEFPGKCGRYTDSNKDKLCDYSQ